MTRILCLWLPNWAIQRIVRGRPELKGRPLALVIVDARGSKVAACCAAAVARGVRPEMPLAEAQSLAPELGVAPYDAAADRRALVKLAEACERFSPRVAVEESDEPESLLLDISNLGHLYGSEAKLIEQVKKSFRRRGYRMQLAVAETVGTAWALAHIKDKQAEAISAPHSSFVIRHSSLPIEALRIPEDTSTLLRDLGIQTIDQLLTLPREELTSRFGDELLRRLDQLTGRGRELIEPERALPALAASYALEEPTGDRHLLMHVLEQLVDQVSRQLAARDQGAVLLTALLRCTGGHELPLRIGLLQPSANARQLLELIELHLENVRLASEVDRVELRAVVTGRLGERQGELFADRWPTDPYQLAVLVNRLGSRLGSERVLRAELRKSPVPERAVKWMPMVESRVESREPRARKLRTQENKSAIPGAPWVPQPTIPLTLYPQPEPAKVVCVAPDGPPQFVWMNHRREPIVDCVGPERIETLWWRGPSVRRDYYRVATQSGAHLWMFRCLTDGKWFTHGEFS
jgi:protein ImuB